MDLTLTVARVFSLFLLALGVGAATGHLNLKELLKSMDAPGPRVFNGFFMIVLGVLLVQHHNIWVKDWPVLVTIVGWATLLKGLSFLAFPQMIRGIGDRFVKVDVKKWSILILALGALFGYYGFLM